MRIDIDEWLYRIIVWPVVFFTIFMPGIYIGGLTMWYWPDLVTNIAVMLGLIGLVIGAGRHVYNASRSE